MTFDAIIAANYSRDEIAALREWANELERLMRAARK